MNAKSVRSMLDKAVFRGNCSSESPQKGSAPLFGKDFTPDPAALPDKQSRAERVGLLGRFAAGIAHDFNNALTAISGNAEILLLKLPENDPARPAADDILKAAEHAAALTRDLLSFIRQIPAQPEVIDLNEIVRKNGALLARIIGDDITFRTVLHPQPLPVVAETVHLEQILTNLAANARDAMPRGGFLTVTTACVIAPSDSLRLGPMRPGAYATVSVSDSGCGMDEITRLKIFKPFFTTKAPGKGTGLGLSMLSEIVKRYNGRIDIKSAPGKGTTFSIMLPLSDASEYTVSITPAVSRVQGGSETILLVDDNDEVRSVTSDLLAGCGYRVVPATDGCDAMKKLKSAERGVDLVILDVLMPHKSGMHVYDELRTWKPGIKTLFASGCSADLIRQAAPEVENFHFIQKPFTRSSLLSTVRRLLDT